MAETYGPPNEEDEQSLLSAFGRLSQLARSPDPIASVSDFLAGDQRGQGSALIEMGLAAQNGTLPPTRKITAKNTFMAAMDETQNPMMAAMAAEENAQLNIKAQAYAANMKAAASPENRVAMATQSYLTSYPEAVLPFTEGGPIEDFAKSFGVPTEDLNDAVSNVKVQVEGAATDAPPGLLTEGMGLQGNGNIPPSVIKAMEEAAPSSGNDGMNGEAAGGTTTWGVSPFGTPGEWGALDDQGIAARTEWLLEWLTADLGRKGEAIEAAAMLYGLQNSSLDEATARGMATEYIEMWLRNNAAILTQGEGTQKPPSPLPRHDRSLDILGLSEGGQIRGDTGELLGKQDMYGALSGGMPTIAFADSKTQYGHIATARMGPYGSRPGAAERINEGYAPALGRFVLGVVLNQQSYWDPLSRAPGDDPGRNPFFFEWGRDKIGTPVSAREKQLMDFNWARLVEVSGTEHRVGQGGMLFREDGESNESLMMRQRYYSVAQNMSFQVAAAMAVAGLGGKLSGSIYGKIDQRRFERHLAKYNMEMGDMSSEDPRFVGLSAWLSEIEDSPWSRALSAPGYKEEYEHEIAGEGESYREPPPPIRDAPDDRPPLDYDYDEDQNPILAAQDDEVDLYVKDRVPDPDEDRDIEAPVGVGGPGDTGPGMAYEGGMTSAGEYVPQGIPEPPLTMLPPEVAAQVMAGMPRSLPSFGVSPGAPVTPLPQALPQGFMPSLEGGFFMPPRGAINQGQPLPWDPSIIEPPPLPFSGFV